MSRVQLALNVSDIDAAVDFYSRMFGTPPAKRRPGYANFAIAEPPLKLVLIENPAEAGTLNHLGVEMMSLAEVAAGLDRARAEGITVTGEGEVECCYARQDKGWMHDPDGAPWELYTVLADADSMTARAVDAGAATDVCCASPADTGLHAVPPAPSKAEATDAACCAAPAPQVVTIGARASVAVPAGDAGSCCG